MDHYLRGYREVSSQIVDYSPQLRIVNVDQLSKGTGCKYMLCILGQSGEYIAKQWKRSPPDKMLKTEFLIRF
jgi:hypothetical protein